MRRMFHGLLSAAFVLALACPTFAESEKIGADKLPKAVVETLKAQFPKGQWKEAEKCTKDGKTLYEVEFTIDGVEHEAMFTETGKLLEYCKEMKVKDLPKSVTSAIEAKYPKSSIKEADEHFEGTMAGFKLEVKDQSGKEWCVKTDSSGKVLDAKSKEEIEKEKKGK